VTSDSVAWVVMAIAAGATLARAQRSPLTVDRVMHVRSVVDAAISPRGDWVAYVVDQVDSIRDQHVRTLWMVGANGGTTVRLTISPVVGSPRWSLDGQHVAFLSGGSGHTQVWAVALRSMATTQLTRSETDVSDFAWSPDGRMLALLASDPVRYARPRVSDGLGATIEPMTHLYVLSMGSRKVRRLTSGPFTVDEVSWAPTGREIAFERRPSPTVADQILGTDIDVVAVRDGKVRPLVHRPGADVSPRWSPDGTQIAFVSHDGRADWLGDTHVCVVSAVGGTPRNLTPALGERILPGEFTLEWRPDGQALYFTVPRGEGSQVDQISLDGQITAITNGMVPHAGPSFSRDGTVMAFVSSDPANPWEAFISQMDRYAPRRLTWSNPELDHVALGEMREVHWTTGDGTHASGLVVLPVGYCPERRYPLIAYIHGGPAWNFVRAFAPQGALPEAVQSEAEPVQVLAGRGYAVFLPNPRGSLGFGRDFRLAAVGDWGGGDFRDVMTGIDTLVVEGIADSSRLGIMGFSYGGTLSAWSLTRTNRFKAAVVGAGVIDPATMYAETDIPELIKAYFLGRPWDEDSLYWTRSTLVHAARIRTPTLIQHGTLDHRVPIDQSRALYRALLDLGVPVTFTSYDGEGHGLTRPSHQRASMRTVVAWFDQWLGPGLLPADLHPLNAQPLTPRDPAVPNSSTVQK
jgi:dipeptidyl aminopeptidase/acylaminoacyl peptidase